MRILIQKFCNGTSNWIIALFRTKTKQKILLTKPLNNILFEVNGITIQAGELQTFISTWMMILCYHVDMFDRTTELALQHCKVWSYQA